MIQKTYIAVQYLSAAGIQFVDKEDDDSHTNLGFVTQTGCLKTHPLSENGDVIQFNYNTFSLEWHSKNEALTFPLNGKSHHEVLAWLDEKSLRFLDQKYQYSFHYDFTYPISSDFVFGEVNSEELQKLLDLRVLAQITLEAVLKENNLVSDIRIWPHHFDTGAY